MNVEERVNAVIKGIKFISTKYDETDDVIHGALATIVKVAGEESAALEANRKAADDAFKAYINRVEANKVAVLAEVGKLPEPTSANIGLKV